MFLFLSVLARFVLVPKLFCSDSEITHHLFSGFMEKKHAIVIGASNLSRIIKDSSHYKNIQILAESGGRHEYYSSSPSSKQNFSKPTLEPRCFEPFLDQGVSSSLSFPTFSTIRSQCHQVSCTLLFFFDPNPNPVAP